MTGASSRNFYLGPGVFYWVKFLVLALQEEVVHVPKVMTATRQVQQHVEQVVEVPIHQSLGKKDVGFFVGFGLC